ncbi:MAG TPA: hypothetical protein VGN72_18350 [Tepidisphaeraceae bacterium]|jgi:hypothetical protein|nr:hypothetical protein [Tepidisphaeraceae bacterium]
MDSIASQSAENEEETAAAFAARFASEAPLPPRIGLAALALPGLRSLKRNWPAIVALQAVGLGVVVAYYSAEPFRAFCNVLADWKTRGGFLAAALLMATVSGLVPEIAKYVFGIDRTLGRKRWRHVAFNCLLYGVLGVLVDAYYRVAMYVVGDEVTLAKVAIKVAADQFLYTPLLGMGVLALAYTWREYRYNLQRTFAALGPHWYVTRVVILLLPCWAYWIPMTSLMYSLPSSLVFVFGAAASAAASLLLTSIANESATTGKPSA